MVRVKLILILYVLAISTKELDVNTFLSPILFFPLNNKILIIRLDYSVLSPNQLINKMGDNI